MSIPGIVISIGADTKDAITGIAKVNTALGKSATKMDKFSAGIKKATLPATAALGALGVAATRAAFKASDLEETMNKVDAVFGDANQSIKDFAKTAPDALGQTEQQALDAATTFGVFGKAANLSGQDLTGFSEQLTVLSSDLASFYNEDPAAVIEALGAGLRGEAEPLRRYGVLLDDATLKAKAFEMGIYEGTGTLTQQQKVLAAQQVILAQTTDAQGDFLKTADGAANQLRIFKANAEQLQTEMGAALLPTLKSTVTAMSNMARLARENQTTLKILVGALAALSAAVIAARIAIFAYETSVKAATIANKLFAASASTTAGKLRLLRLGALGAAAAVGAVALEANGGSKKFSKYYNELENTESWTERVLASTVLMAKEFITGKDAVTGIAIRTDEYTASLRSATSATVDAAIAQGRLNAARDAAAAAAYTSSSNQAIRNNIAKQVKDMNKARDAAEELANTMGDGPTGSGSSIKEATNYIKRTTIKVIGDMANGFEVTATKLDKLNDKHKEFISEGLSALNASIQEEFTKRKQALEEAEAAYASAAASIADTVRSAIDVRSVVDALLGTEEDWKKAWERTITNAIDFSTVLNQLTAGGASEELINLVAGQGPQAGTELGKAIIADGMIPQMNADLASVDAAALGAGEQFAQKFYQPGVDSAQEFLNGMNGWIQSNLKEFYSIGRSMGLAMRRGFNAAKPAQASSYNPTRTLVSVPTGNTRSGEATVYAQDSGGTTINITTGVGDPVAIAREVRRILNRGTVRTGVAL